MPILPECVGTGICKQYYAWLLADQETLEAPAILLETVNRRGQIGLVSAFHHRVARYTLCLDDNWIWKRREGACQYTGGSFSWISSPEELIWAAFLSRHPTVANYFMVKLTVFKAMAQELADLFGLTLPESLEKQTHLLMSTGTSQSHVIQSTSGNNKHPETPL